MTQYKIIAQTLRLGMLAGTLEDSGTVYSDFRDFIEAKHKKSDVQGKVFYQNLIHAMPQKGMTMGNVLEEGLDYLRETNFKDVTGYCMEKIAEIENGTSKENEGNSNSPLLKLNWNGNNNQLYDVLRKLKEKGFLTNSYPDLAYFLKSNFDNFNNTQLSTIQTELERGKRPPKSRRIELDDLGQSE